MIKRDFLIPLRTKLNDVILSHKRLNNDIKEKISKQKLYLLHKYVHTYIQTYMHTYHF